MPRERPLTARYGDLSVAIPGPTPEESSSTCKTSSTSGLSTSGHESAGFSEREKARLSNAYLGPSGLVNQAILSFIDPTSIDTEDLLQTTLQRRTGMCMLICSCTKLDTYDMYSGYAQAIQTQLDANYERAVGPTVSKALLPPQTALKIGKKTLVLDMDETLIHSTFASIKGADVIRLPVKTGANGGAGNGGGKNGKGNGNGGNNGGSRMANEESSASSGGARNNNADADSVQADNSNCVSVLFRPFVEDFLLALYPYYELVIFTASLPEYANKVLALLEDRVEARANERKMGKGVFELFSAKLYRSSCVPFQRNYVKDLSLLGRDLKNVILFDNNPICFSFQPDNGILSNTWCGNRKDAQLKKIVPILIKLSSVDDVRTVIGSTDFQLSIPK